MTLQQMRYAIMIAEKQSFGKAADALFISQPSLSNAIQSMEKELGLQIFIRTTKGVQVSPRGRIFIDSAKRIVAQVDSMLVECSSDEAEPHTYFSVSSLPYVCASKAFSQMLSSVDETNYNLCIRETNHLGVIQDVSSQHSEIGVLDISFDSEQAVSHILKKNQLEFYPLHTTQPHVLINAEHPLANQETIALEDLSPYPYIYYERDTLSCGESLVLSRYKPKSRLLGKDRSTLIMLLRTTNGYAISNGLIDHDVYAGLTAIPVSNLCEKINVGWIKRQDVPLNLLGKQYIQYLESEIQSELGG